MQRDLQWTRNFNVLGGRSTHRYGPALVLVVAGLTTLISSAICIAAVLAPAPAAALPLVVVVCVGCPLFGAWEVPAALASLRADRARVNALATLRETLERLPEVEHPLGY